MNIMITRIIRLFNEHSFYIPIIQLSKDQCCRLWMSKTNESNDGNRPIDYANRDISLIQGFIGTIDKYVNINDKILELGCNCGVNLNQLSISGYTKLYGIEINKNAINEMNKSFPGIVARIQNNSFEDGLKNYKENLFDLVFSIDTLYHTHPSSNFIFKEVVRISKKYICVVEAEDDCCAYIFPRNYKRMFENLGCKQVFECKFSRDTCSHPIYTLRLFEKE